MWDLVPQPGIKRRPPALGVIRPPGGSSRSFLFNAETRLKQLSSSSSNSVPKGFLGGSAVKNPPAGAAGDMGSIPGSGRSLGGGHGNPLHYSCLENPMDREAWRATDHGVAKSWTRLKGLSMLHTVGYEKLERSRFLFLWASGKDSPCSPGSPGPRLHWRNCGMVRQRNWLRAEFPKWGEKQRKGHLISYF